ncbi:uncharacterized protein LOC108024439 [Drosophila biarmipes]|uniref:uncharacterized protein LOC108024439 n=1 Tax=Drosophila biarmipes TaxID=125945 RepID=UPI0007E84BD7|nr:uncharacterized protein LOC108024439 [Drosophila biarmipes]
MSFQGSWCGLLLIFSLLLINLKNGARAASPQCKSTEILSENGCVDREFFLNRIILRSWKDQGFERAKARAGLVDEMKCRENEIRTPFGCSKPPFPPRRDTARSDVHHSILLGDQIIFSNFGEARGSYKAPVMTAKEKRVPYSGPPISAHNRIRKHYIIPGRLLRTGRRCRPYEFLGQDGQCHRRKGKKGNYEHKDHVYGLQLRHRHEAKPPG